MTQFTASEELYVLTCERDTYQPAMDSRPIAFEQFLDNGAASIEAVKKQRDRLGDTYGKTRIARLQFVDDDAEPLE